MVLLCVFGLLSLLLTPVYALDYIFTPIYDPGTDHPTYAWGIDGSKIVGQFGDNTGEHGFLDENNTWTELDYRSSIYVSIPYGIDGDNIVGTYLSWFSNIEARYHGFLYDGSNWESFDYPNNELAIAHIKTQAPNA